MAPASVGTDASLLLEDYDCFYAAVFEADNPALKALPLVIQQKQIAVTCNYEARRRGLYKLQLITEARERCPDLVIVSGEDIGRFRDASKILYQFLRRFSWNDRVERLGFDEVWMDVTDLVDYNAELLNPNDLAHSFFGLSQTDPTIGFSFDASEYAGHTYPEDAGSKIGDCLGEQPPGLDQRLRLASHLAMNIRTQMEATYGYTCSVGISTSKILSKLVGDVKKPRAQTTLVPPYEGGSSNVTHFLDPHEVGKVPNIGFKAAQALRSSFLGRQAEHETGLVYGGTKEHVTVHDVRTNPQLDDPEFLERLLRGANQPHGIGHRVWCLLHGVDDDEVKEARTTPRQISIEDSYIRLDTLDEATKELKALSRSLIRRMHIDLLQDVVDDDGADRDTDAACGTSAADQSEPRTAHNVENSSTKRWIVHPRTLRLSTRPRGAVNPEGGRSRSFARQSRSAPLPSFVFSLSASVDALSDRLVNEALLPLFRKLHPERSGWNLSLVNIAVTNMVEAGGETKAAGGRDICRMFKRQEDVLRDFRITSGDQYLISTAGGSSHLAIPESSPNPHLSASFEGDLTVQDEGDEDSGWDDDDPLQGMRCQHCGSTVPSFAATAHERFHSLGD